MANNSNLTVPDEAVQAALTDLFKSGLHRELKDNKKAVAFRQPPARQLILSDVINS